MEERGRQEEIKESNKEVKGIGKDNDESNILTKKKQPNVLTIQRNNHDSTESKLNCMKPELASFWLPYYFLVNFMTIYHKI